MEKIFLKSKIFYILWVPYFKFTHSIYYIKRKLMYLFFKKNNNSKYYEPIRDQVSRVSKTINSSKKDFNLKNKQNILFATVNGNAEIVLAQELVIGLALQERGANISALSCDSALPANSWNVIGNSKLPPYKNGTKLSKLKGDQLIKKSHKAILDVHANAGFFVHELNDYSNKNDIKNALKIVEKNWNKFNTNISYKGVNINEHAYASLLRITLRGSPLENEETFWLYRRLLVSGIVYVSCLERFFEKNKIDKVVEVHGIYLEHGIVLDYCKEIGIPVIVYGRPYRKGCILLSHNDTYHREIPYEHNSRWENITLSSKDQLAIDTHLNSKVAGGRENVNYHPNPIEDFEKISEEIGIDKNIPVVSMFTNILWDAQIIYDSNAFSDMLDWIYQTIEYMKKRQDLQLVIRVHPAESKGGFTTNQPLFEDINKVFPELPKNVFVVKPESDVSSVVLSNNSIASIIYGTKLGIEIACNGVPLIIAGESYARGKGFSIDVDTSDSYFKLLDNIKLIKKPNDENIKRAKKFAFHYFFRRMITFPFVETDSIMNTDSKINLRSLNDLEPSKNENLDVICNGILNETPFEAKYY